MNSNELTSTIPRNNHFIFIRYLAAFSIMISHSRQMIDLQSYNYIVGKISWFLPGVPMLFLISGFLISLSYKDNEPWLTYIVKRVLRVFPPLWACTLLSIFALFLSGYLPTENFSWGEFFFWVAGQLTVLQVYHPTFLDEFGNGVLNGSLWVIPVIFQFYLLLPFVVKLDKYLSDKYSPNWIYIGLTILAVINVVFHYMSNFHESVITKVLFLTLFPWAFIFFLGYFLQRNFNKLIKGNWKHVLIFASLHVGLYLLLSSLGFKWGRNDVNPINLFILSMLILNIAFLPSFKTSILNRLEKFIANNDFTFGLFVYHIVIMNFLIQYEILIDQPYIRVVAMFLITILVALLSVNFLEKPIKNHRNKILNFTLKIQERIFNSKHN